MRPRLLGPCQILGPALLGVASAHAADERPADAPTENAAGTARAVVRNEARTARADLPDRLADRDTADGRVDGDAAIVVGIGATFTSTAPRAAAELRLRYLETAGVFFTYEDSFGSGSADPRRVLALGLELRPLFLGRWVSGYELGLRTIDLLVDSFGLELGTFFEPAAPEAFASTSGLQAGVGIEAPLLGGLDGPWIDLHGGARWTQAVLAGGSTDGPADRSVFVTITVAYHRTFATHLVDLRDSSP